jgi:hypothetical protein
MAVGWKTRRFTVDEYHRMAQAGILEIGERGLVWIQNPVELAAVDSEPQPDVAILHPRDDVSRWARIRRGRRCSSRGSHGRRRGA